jgi:hypothetical protein
MRSSILRGLMSLSLLLIGLCVKAQSAHTISGQVVDENQKPITGATVFIDGTQAATATNETGRFNMVVPGPGSYRLSVKMLGYDVARKEVMLKETSINVDFTLAVKSFVLNQVNIGSDKNWAKNFEIFKKQFLGNTPNALKCRIVNPEVINFSTKKNVLLAGADDFLIIENPQLGYRIKYLLKTFQHNTLNTITSYDGDVVFEELPGAPRQKTEWAKNRQLAYAGSMMHFLRSVFTNTTLQEGFIVNQVYKRGSARFYDNKPVKFDTLVTALDTAFVQLHFTGLHIIYDPGKAAGLLKQEKAPAADNSPSNTESRPKGSELTAYAKEIIIDASGKVFSGALMSFLIRGEWTYKRVADQLPFEYQPSTQPSSP